MPTRDEHINAAKKKPSERTAHEQHLVDSGSNIQAVRNADFEARRQERAFGKGRKN